MNMNLRMKSIYYLASYWVVLSVSGELQKLVEDGFVEVDGCVFLKYLYQDGINVSSNDFPDKTSFECFINLFHLDDYVENNWVSYALLVINHLFKKFREQFGNRILRAIVAVDDVSCTIRLHVRRKGEAWLDSNLEKYQEEGVLVMDSNTDYKLNQQDQKQGSTNFFMN